MRGADLLVKTLKAAGTSRIFSLSGNQIMPIYDACLEHGVEIIHTRHEAAAVFMAEAHAQLTGEVGVALVTAGGGLTNAVGPLFSIRESETSVLLLSGDSPIGQDSKGAFQEMPQRALTEPLTKLSMRPASAAHLGSAVAKAIRRARAGRPGPVHISVGFDIVQDDAGAAEVPDTAAFLPASQFMPSDSVDYIQCAIAGAQNPIILCGPATSLSRKGALLDRLSHALDCPVIVVESPRGLRDPSQGNIAKVFEKADLVICLGKRVDFTLSFGNKDAFKVAEQWIVIDPDESEFDRASLNLGSRLKKTILSSPSDAAEQLIVANKTGSTTAINHTAWREEVATELAKRNIDRGSIVEGRISSAELCEAVQRKIGSTEKTIAICDGGEFGQWAQAMTSADRRIVNGVSGVIGGGVPYGLAASLCAPDHLTFVMTGDGSIGFQLAELETAARHGTAYVIVIGNDMRWNAEHVIQMREYGPDRLIGCQLSPARYDLAAEALGGHGEYVTRFDELDAAITRAVNSKKVACVNVLIDGAPAPAGH